MVSGVGTGVGKTIVSAVLTTLFQGDYWKPVQCGKEEGFDTDTMKMLIDTKKHHVYEPAYSFHAPVSPHHAARLEKTSFDAHTIIPPETTRPLIIEGVGGIYVPLTTKLLTIDLFASWDCQWVVVSRHYLGSINHTLLTIDALKQRKIPILGLVFNGEPHPDSEEAILQISQLPLLGRILPEVEINRKTIQRYVEEWQAY
ncbi:MAG: dethiobiotin synthase [Parachlamydiaceae bacterium]